MRKTRISLILIVVLAFSAIPFGLFIVSVSGSTEPLPDYEPMDIGYEMRKSIELVEALSFEGIPKTSGWEDYQYQIGDNWWWLTYGWGYGYFYELFELRAMNDDVEIWVGVDLSYPEGDPRNPIAITDAQCDYMLEEFSGNIIPTDVDYFGTPDELVGIDIWGDGYWYDEDAKTVMLVSNIIDDSYFDSTYPAYVVGFYSPTLEYNIGRNIISIDAYDWENRVGDDVARPNLYESTVAHEYQHLIHDDIMPDSATWMNEACSLFAEPLCGYTLDAGQIESLMATPDNSLTKWGDQNDINILADYGASLLWALYITSHYGFDIMGRYLQNGEKGVEGLNDVFPEGVTFEDVFHDWKLANLIKADHGKYSYSSFGFDINSLKTPLNIHEIKGKKVDVESAADFFGETVGGDFNDPPYPTGVSEIGPFGTEYIYFPDAKGLELFEFNGDDIAPWGWTYDDYWGKWWSGAEDLADFLLTSNSYVVQAGDNLSVPSWYDIEPYWDFGFVQISEDGGETWTSMANEWTVLDHDPSAHPDIIPQLPGITNSTEGGYRDLTFVLEDYVGKEVMFGFRYMTDWYTTHAGWYIVGAYIGATELELTPTYPEADFEVTIVSKYSFWGHEFWSVRNMWLKDDLTEEGATILYGSRRVEVYVLISPIQENGFVDYGFKLSKFKIFRRGHCYH